MDCWALGRGVRERLGMSVHPQDVCLSVGCESISRVGSIFSLDISCFRQGFYGCLLDVLKYNHCFIQKGRCFLDTKTIGWGEKGQTFSKTQS